MSTAEILEELPKLNSNERRKIRNKLDELEPVAEQQPRGTLGGLIRLRQQFPPDPEFADILEKVYRELRREPARNPWD